MWKCTVRLSLPCRKRLCDLYQEAFEQVLIFMPTRRIVGLPVFGQAYGLTDTYRYLLEDTYEFNDQRSSS